MRFDLIQAVAVACHGSEFLANGGKASPPELTATHGSFRRVHRSLWERSGSNGPLAVAEGTAPWFRRLEAERVRRVQLVLTGYPYPKNVRAGPWGILTDGASGIELWRPLWRPRGAETDDPRPWRVVYTADRYSKFSLNESIPVAEARATLLNAASRVEAHFRARELDALADYLAACCAPILERPCDSVKPPDYYPASWNRDAVESGFLAIRFVEALSGPDWNDEWCSSAEELQDFRAASNLLWVACLSCVEASVGISGIALRSVA